MEEDERYWSGPSTLKAFDFEDGPQRDESVLKLFGMGGGGAASNHPHQDGIPLSAISPDDMDLHSSTSDEVSSVRSESVIEEAPKSSSFAKNLKDKVIRTRSTLSSSRSTASSIVPSVPVRVPSSPTFSATSNKSYVKPVQMVQPPEILVRQRSDSSASNSQLQSEIQYLRRNLEARKDQWIKLSPKEMVSEHLLQNEGFWTMRVCFERSNICRYGESSGICLMDWKTIVVLRKKLPCWTKR